MNLKTYLPFLRWFPMKAIDVRSDLLAGLTVAMVLIPQSMAYAELAGLPVWMGLYAAFLPVIIGGLWGSSDHLQTGPGATMALIISSVLIPLAAVGSEEYVTLAIQLAFLVGIIWALLALFRLGFVINFLSRPVIEGFINAGGILIAFSQVVKMLGVPAERSGRIFYDLLNLFHSPGNVNVLSVTIGAVSLALLLLGRRFIPKVPVALLIAVVSTALVYFLGWHDPARVGSPLAIVGEIPAGLPKPVWPVPGAENLMVLLPGAITFAFVGFMETCSVARGIAARSHQKLNVNQEAVGQSIASFATAFSGGQPINGSFSRSALNFASGARSGMAAVFTGIFVLVFLLVFTPAFYYLPKTVLAAIIIAAVIKLMNFRQLASFYKVDRGDGIAAWVTFGAVLVLAPELEKGILLGASVSILLHLYRMMRPNVVTLGRHKDGALRDAHLHNLEIDYHPLPIRLDGRLFFANASYFEDQVHEALEKAPDAHFVAIICDGINAMDASGAEMLKELYGQLKHRDIQLLLVGVKNMMLHTVKTSGLDELVGSENFFGTYEHAHQAVLERLVSTKENYSI